MNTPILGDCFATLSFISFICWAVVKNADALAFREVSEPFEQVKKVYAPVVVGGKGKSRRKRVTSIDQLPIKKAIFIRNVDGDTSHYKVDGVEVSVRYTGIDTPELHFFSKAQKGGQEALDYLTTLVKKGDEAEFRVDGVAAHKRMSAFIFNNQKFINEEMIKAGWAWPCPDYLKKFPELADKWNKLFEQAKKEKRGVWSLEKNPMEPWKWRDEQDRLHKRGKYKK
jgi:endonuclease YncB( thermonuclease family)